MKFDAGLHVSERATEWKGKLHDVYIIPAHKEWGKPGAWGHLIHSIHQITQLKNEHGDQRKHGVVVVLNHTPGDSEAERENRAAYIALASLNGDTRVSRSGERDVQEADRFSKMLTEIKTSGVPIIPVYVVEEGMSVAIARHEGGRVADELLVDGRSRMITIDAETSPDKRALVQLRKAFDTLEIDVAAIQVIYDMQSLQPHEYGPYMNWQYTLQLRDITLLSDEWKNALPDVLAQYPGFATVEDIFQTPGAGTVITRDAYRVVGGWPREKHMQRGEDVHISQQAALHGMKTHQFGTEIVQGENTYIFPVVHRTIPRSQGRADGQGRHIARFNEGDATFGDLLVPSLSADRAKRDALRVCALLSDGWMQEPEARHDFESILLEDTNVSNEVVETLWKQVASWG
ncbi:MAG: hypothetical protein RI911_81, partial [Candidatus Parcubacteria bacterium]